MITRYVFVRLLPDHQGEASAIAAYTREALSGLPQIRSLEVGRPADAHAAKGWDLSIAVTFDDLEAVEAYRIHPVHRAYVDDYLKPRMKVIKAWNFDLV